MRYLIPLKSVNPRCPHYLLISRSTETENRWTEPIMQRKTNKGDQARFARLAGAALLWWLALARPAACETVLKTYPTGDIYDYRWKVLELALRHASGPAAAPRLQPLTENLPQSRALQLLDQGEIDVMALPYSPERERAGLPIRLDISYGILGYRLLVIRKVDQDRIDQMDDLSFRKTMTFGMNSQWADVGLMQANGLSVLTTSNTEAMFTMLSVGRFDAFSRGLNEADRELSQHQISYPDLMIDQTRALYYPFPVYFWVRQGNQALADQIAKGLKAALADGSIRQLFLASHAGEIAEAKSKHRRVLMLNNPLLPTATPLPDTSPWWPN